MKKNFKETLSAFLTKKNKEKKQDMVCFENQKEMKKASNSYKSIMEIHNILVDVYNKLINSSKK